MIGPSTEESVVDDSPESVPDFVADAAFRASDKIILKHKKYFNSVVDVMIKVE